MDYIFWTGIIGSILLVLGAAWPEPKHTKNPRKSVKNWLFTIGGLAMLLYAILGYQKGGPVFYVFLEVMIGLASIMMMLDVPDRIDTPVIILSGIGSIIWSLKLFEGYNTIIFITGLSIVGLGYALEMGTLRRSVCLMCGSFLVALFSYLEASWIFFWLNLFSGIFAGYYVTRGISEGKKK